ncbi:MAG: AsmA family protein [Acidobacteria bacterium]|nr:AsmA family protein [Acidobacteriota bacterium]
MASPGYSSKGFRLAAIVVGGLLLILLVGPYLVSIDRYRDLIVEQLEKQTARDIEIEALRLHVLPRLRVQLVNFRVKNPAGFPEGDAVAIESLDLGLAFWPLLRREIEIDSVTVQALQANLLSNEQGQTNYEMPRRRRRAPTKAAEAPGVSLTRIGDVALEDAKVSSGTFWSRERRIYPSWAVAGINVEVENVDLSDPKWLGKLRAQMDLSTIEVSTPTLKESLRFTDGEVQVKANAASGDFELALGELRATGTLKVADLARPVADFTLTMEELNVAEVSAAAGSKPKGSSGPRGGGGGGGSRRLLARGTVQIDRVLIPPLSVENLKGQARLYTDRLEVDPCTLDLYGGRSRGSLGVNLNQTSLPASVSFRAEGVNVAQAVAAASPAAQGKLTGTFEADGRVGVPLGEGDPLAGLAGEGTFAVRNGTFPGLNVEGTLAGMAKFLQMDVPKGDTRFSFFGGDYRIAGQRVHNRNLRLEAETLEASLGGSFGFDQTLNYTGWGVLRGKGGDSQATQEQQGEKSGGGLLGGFRKVFGEVARQTIGRMRVPFSVTGTFQEPSFILAGTPTPVR